MVEQPGLFLEALRESGELRDAKRLRDGPEGECLADLRIIEAVIARLCRRLRSLCPGPAHGLDPWVVVGLRHAVPRLRTAISALTHQIERFCDDPERDPPDRAHPGSAGQKSARDQQAAGSVA